MKANGRKFGEKQSYPFPVWNGLFEHRKRLKSAIWEFLWCLDAITNEKDGVGLVHGGAPVKIERIAADLKVDEKTVRLNLQKLAQEGYLKLRRTAYGYVVHVLNSFKFGIWSREKLMDKNARSLTHGKSNGKARERAKTPDLSRTRMPDLIRHSSDSAVEEASPHPLGEEWVVLGVDTPIGSPNFQRFWKSIYEHRNGQPLSRLMETCAQGWWATGKKKKQHVPPPFWEAKRRVEERERQETERCQEREMVRAKVPA
ncbi:MAG: hypothetical protein IH847_05405 [Acidobacteria bacterium]|nr:hypothetical protein [Acidobacteriota bacterium]